jgi:chromosomal replication initiation ATPase DnaA
MSSKRKPLILEGLAGRVIDVCAAHYHTSRAEILGPKRDRHLARARWCAALAFTTMGASSKQIAALMNRDYSTILHGLRQSKGVKCIQFQECVKAAKAVFL